jgi:5-methylcytosine-specific restriction protein A
MSSREGERLNREWRVNARHALYHKDGTWYHVLTSFPGALFDPHGYILFRTESEFLNCRYLSIGEEVNVHGHISRIPGYVRVR